LRFGASVWYYNLHNLLLTKWCLTSEAKFLQRMGIDVPESARMVLLQEDKFKCYLNELTFALKEYERVLALVPPVCKPIIRPHLEDLDRKIQPGMVILTWASMNIDGFLNRVHTGLAKLEELIQRINDIMDNRIEHNLKHISRTMMVDLPQNQSFTLDQLVALQEKTIKRKSTLMDQRNLQVERAVDDLVGQCVCVSVSVCVSICVCVCVCVICLGVGDCVCVCGRHNHQFPARER